MSLKILHDGRDRHLSVSLSFSLPILQKRETEPREVKSPLQGHTARKCPGGSADSQPDSHPHHLTVMINFTG